MTTVSRAVALFGTEEPVEPARTLHAGPLSAELENGALRYVRYHGVEVLRGIAYLVRDERWATAKAEIRDLEVAEDGGGFRITYRARARMGEGAFAYEAEIIASPEGSLRFAVTGRAERDLRTHRTGFVVLHPVEGVVDRPLRVTHGDGRIEETRFPRLISPAQPVFDIRALAHEAPPGVWATCRMDAADVFEMEDQRNWTDASYKTYVRPLALPHPYTIRAGEVVQQTVTLTFEGSAGKLAVPAGDGVTVRVGEATGLVMPRLGLGVPAEAAAASLAVAELVAKVGPQELVCGFDPRQGHGLELLRQYRELGRAAGAAVVLELVLPCERPPAQELAEVARQVSEARLALAAIVVSPAVYLMSYQPDGPWPDCPPLEEVYDATRRAFPGLPVGGGMLSYFTELNRKRPSAEHIDLVTHTTCPIVHDADDRSVMETLEALPWVIESTKAFAGGRPYRIGPSAIGMRHNPYGKAPVDNQANVRIAMARNDPRQRGLFGAAWNLGYVAACARGGIEALALSAPVGPDGIVHSAQPFPQPYLDRLEGRPVYPLFHVLAGLAAGAGRPQREVDCAGPVAALAYDGPAGPELWLANLTGEEQQVLLADFASDVLVQRLDAASFVAAATDAGWGWRGGLLQRSVEPVVLDAYACACILPTA